MRRGNYRKFGRKSGQRQALYKSLATALIDHGKIKTTSAKAKSLSSFADKLVTTARKADISSRRELTRTFHPKTVTKLINEIAPRFSDKKGGYTRVIRLERRKSDGSQMAIIEWTTSV